MSRLTCCPCIKSEHLLIVRLDKHWKRYKNYDEPLQLKRTKYQLSVNNKIVNGMVDIKQLTSFSRITADRLLLIRHFLVSGTYTYRFIPVPPLYSLPVYVAESK